MFKKVNRLDLFKSFIFFSLLAVFCLHSPAKAQAQFLPWSYGFPSYAYFNPFISFPSFSPLLAPTAFPFPITTPPISYPTATIQGTTIYTTATGLKITAPGVGALLTGIIPPVTIFIYPSGYLPPLPPVPIVVAPAPIPTIVAPPIIPTPILAPSPVLPVVTTPAFTVTPTVTLPVATTTPAAISGFNFWLFNPFFSFAF